MKAALGLLAFAVLFAAGWLLFTRGDGPEMTAVPPSPEAAERTEAAVLEPAAASLSRAESFPIATSEAGGAVQQMPHLATFRGKLRVLSGDLPNPPALTVRLGAVALGQEMVERMVPMRAGELSFEVPASDASCQVRFAKIIQPVRAIGGTVLEDGWVRFNAPEEALIVEVEVKPHAGVIFLRDPDGAPLAGGTAWYTVLAVKSSSATDGAILGDDGLLIFEDEFLTKVAGADTVTFGVRRPPDIGSSESASFAIQDFLALPRPVVLRFPATERLRFHILDAARQPVTGATVRIGHLSETPPSDPEGWAEMPQSSPPGDRVIVEAKGFVRETAPISLAAQQEGQEIEMRPSSSIWIVADEAPKQGWGDMKALVDFDGRADGSAILPERFEPGSFIECRGATGYISDRERLNFNLDTGFSEAGQVLLDGIHSDVPARVRVLWNGLVLLDERVPLRPGDGEHLVSLGSLPPLAGLHGVVTNPDGLPMAGAKVRLSGGSWSDVAETGQDGRFDLGESAIGSTVRIRVSASGWTPLEIEHRVEEGDPDSAGTLCLETGRSVSILVLAPDGAPFVPLAGSIAEDFRPVLHVYGEWLEPVKEDAGSRSLGSWRFENVPLGTFTSRLRFRWNIAGDERRVDTIAGNGMITLTAQEFDMLNTPQ